LSLVEHLVGKVGGLVSREVAIEHRFRRGGFHRRALRDAGVEELYREQKKPVFGGDKRSIIRVLGRSSRGRSGLTGETVLGTGCGAVHALVGAPVVGPTIVSGPTATPGTVTGATTALSVTAVESASRAGRTACMQCANPVPR